MVAAKGGESLNNISVDTDYIILGGSNASVRKSSKLVQAEKLMNAGYKIEIISEKVFMKLLG